MTREYDNSSELLRGRREIAEYIRASPKIVDRLIDLGIIPIFRPGGTDEGLMYTTKRLINQGFENAAGSKQDAEFVDLFQQKGGGKRGKT